MSTPVIPAVGTRAHRVNGALADFFANNPHLELGGVSGFTAERRNHMEVFALHRIHENKVNPIGQVEFTAIRGPHGTIPIRVLYPSSGEARRRRNKAGAIIYFHGGGYSVGSVDEFENGLRLVAEEAECQVTSVPTYLPASPTKRPPRSPSEPFVTSYSGLRSRLPSSTGVPLSDTAGRVFRRDRLAAR